VCTDSACKSVENVSLFCIFKHIYNIIKTTLFPFHFLISSVFHLVKLLILFVFSYVLILFHLIKLFYTYAFSGSALFTAYSVDVSDTNTLRFYNVITNLDNDYNSSTGVFTCRIPGYYHSINFESL